MKNRIKDLIKQKRHQKYLSLRKLANVIGCSSSYIHDIECGRKIPLKTKIMRDICKVLDIDLSVIQAEYFYKEICKLKNNKVKENLFNILLSEKRRKT